MKDSSNKGGRDLPVNEPKDLGEKPLKERSKEGKLSNEELAEIKKGVERSEKLAFVLDDAMLDPILGIFEGAGDAATGIAGLYIVYQAKKAGMSSWELTKMLGRQGFDFLAGSIPVVGDIFDFVYKSNKKNAEALRAHFEKIEKESMNNNGAKINTEKQSIQDLDKIKMDQLKKGLKKS